MRQEEASQSQEANRDWDGKMKGVFYASPKDFVKWLAKGAEHKGEFAPEFPSILAKGDALLHISENGEESVLHIEFQTKGDAEMGKRLLYYNVMAQIKLRLPVWSVVMYLTPVGPFPPSPYEGYVGSRRSVLLEFDTIKLWEVPTETLLELGLPGLLPLLPLTREGRDLAVVDEMIARLSEKEHENLLLLAYGFTSLVFVEEEERKLVRERFSMLDKDLMETWAFQELTQKAREQALEQGLQEGLQKGLQEGRNEQRQFVVALVQAHFPQLTGLAQECVNKLQSQDEIQKIIIDISMLHHEDEVRELLLRIK